MEEKEKARATEMKASSYRGRKQKYRPRRAKRKREKLLKEGRFEERDMNDLEKVFKVKIYK